MRMAKRDLKKELRGIYFPSREPEIVDVPPLTYAMVDGRGNPNSTKDYQGAIQALYTLSYTLKFATKKEGAGDYTVMPLESLWWTEPDGSFDVSGMDRVEWTAMILQPDLVTQSRFDSALAAAMKKKPQPALGQVRLERLEEGRAAQVLHVGPYAAEKPTIERLHQFLRKEGYEPRGKHHEIYLGDPRRTAPERLKTVVRQPVG